MTKPSENTIQPQASTNAQLKFTWKLAEGNDDWVALLNEPAKSQPSKFKVNLECHADGFDWSCQDHVDHLNATRRRMWNVDGYIDAGERIERGETSSSPNPSNDIIRSKGPVSYLKPSEWQFVKGTDLSDVAINEEDPSKLVMEVEKSGDPSTRLFYDFCAGDVPIYGRPYFDWRKQDHISFLSGCRKQVIDLYGRRVAGATFSKGKASTAQPQLTITIPSAYTIQPPSSSTAPQRTAWPGQLCGNTDATNAVLNNRNDLKFKIRCGIPGTKWLVRFELAGRADFDWGNLESINELNFERNRIIQEYGGQPTGGAVDFTLRWISSPAVLPLAPAPAVPSTVPPFFDSSPQVLESASSVTSSAPDTTSESALGPPATVDLLPADMGISTPSVGSQPSAWGAPTAANVQHPAETKNQRKNRMRKEAREGRKAGRGSGGAGAGT